MEGVNIVPISSNRFDRFSDTSAAARAGLVAMGAAILDVSNPACPVDTGNLKRSVVSVVDMAERAVYVGPAADYGEYVHNGHAAYTDKAGRYHKERKPTPWLRDTAEANKRSIGRAGVAAYGRELGR